MELNPDCLLCVRWSFAPRRRVCGAIVVFAQLQRTCISHPKPLKRADHRLGCWGDSEAMRFKCFSRLRFVERIITSLPASHAKQRRHARHRYGRRPSAAVAGQRVKKRTQQVGNGGLSRRCRRPPGCKSCDIADRINRLAAGSTPIAMLMFVHFLGLQHLADIRFPGVQISLPRSGNDGLRHAIARLFRRPAGRIAFHQKQLAPGPDPGLTQSASFTRQRGSGDDGACGATFWPVLGIVVLAHWQWPAWRFSSPLVGMLIEPQRKGILDRALHDARRFTRRQFLLGLAGNCARRIFMESTKLTPSQTSSGVSFKPRRHQVPEFAKLPHCVRCGRCAGPLTCVPPSTVGINSHSFPDGVFGTPAPRPKAQSSGTAPRYPAAVKGLRRQPLTLAQFSRRDTDCSAARYRSHSSSSRP